jgi:hypothetical protein
VNEVALALWGAVTPNKQKFELLVELNWNGRMVCSWEEIKITLYSQTGCIGLHIVLPRPTFFHTGLLLSPAVAALETV